MRFTWDEAKRKSNRAKHGLDFADVSRIFAGPIVLFEDSRFDYGGQRLIAVGLLDALVVVVVHIESGKTVRVISIRKADKHETNLYFQNVGTL